MALRASLRVFITAAMAVGLFLPVSPANAALRQSQGKKPQYTGKLSSNPAIRKQQLIIDPEGILGGSVTVKYDPTVVTLVDAQDPADYAITGGFVSVANSPGTAVIRQPLADYLSSHSGSLAPRAIENGSVQVFFQDRSVGTTGLRAAGGSVIPVLPGYFTVAQDGATGINDTHSLLFEYLPGVNPRTKAVYDIFAAPAIGAGGADSLTLEGDPNPVPYSEIGKASVVGSLVPLPPAIWMALSCLPLIVVATTLARRRTKAIDR